MSASRLDIAFSILCLSQESIAPDKRVTRHFVMFDSSQKSQILSWIGSLVMQQNLLETLMLGNLGRCSVNENQAESFSNLSHVLEMFSNLSHHRKGFSTRNH